MKQCGNGREQAPVPGPRDCLRTRQAPADCRTCGAALVTIRHTPMRLPGSHCSECCPCCVAERDSLLPVACVGVMRARNARYSCQGQISKAVDL